MKNIIKNIVLIIFIIFQISSTYSQEKVRRIYIVSSLATNKPDDRIIGTSIPIFDRVVQYNKDTPPDNVFETSIGVGYKLFETYNFNLSTGISYIYERNNYYRPLNHCALLKEGQPCTYDLRFLDIYSYNIIGNTISVDYELKVFKKFYLKAGCFFQTDMKFLGYYFHKLSLMKRYHWKFDFMSFDLDPYAGFRLGRYDLTFYKRLWYYHKVDRAIHHSDGGDYPGIKEDYETYNPDRWGIVLKYWF